VEVGGDRDSYAPALSGEADPKWLAIAICTWFSPHSPTCPVGAVDNTELPDRSVDRPYRDKAVLVRWEPIAAGSGCFGADLVLRHNCFHCAHGRGHRFRQIVAKVYG